MPLLATFLVLSFTTIVGVGGYFVFRANIKKRILGSLDTKLFIVKLPREEREGKELKQELGRFEHFVTSLAAFKKPITLEAAVSHIGEEICFYASVPAGAADSFAKQVRAVWGDANVSPAEDYNVFNYTGAFAVATVRQQGFFGVPVRTYVESESDPFASILGGLARIGEVGEGGAIQVIIRPASRGLQGKVKDILKQVRNGTSLKSAVGKSVFSEVLGDVANFAGSKKGEAKNEPKTVDAELVASLERKLSKQFFEVNVRVVSSAPSEFQANAILDSLTAGFSQFESPNRNEFRTVAPRRAGDLLSAFSFREFREGDSMVLNAEELASIFHFPTPFTETPKVHYASFRETPPPANLPREGIILGESRYRGEVRQVRMQVEDRRRHLYVIGQTGTGKSVLLNRLSSQDIEAKNGTCVIDPNGDLFTDVLARIPRSRAQDVIIFDPSDLSRPVGINMLEYDPAFPEQKTFIINELLSIFNTLYDLKATGGPMFEQYMRNALLLLMDDPANGFTLTEVPRVLADSAFRKKLLAVCRNVIVKNFWEKEAEKAGGEASLANMVPYITSKFSTFISNDYVRPIIAQSKSTINFRSIIDGKKILLVNLSKGKIGDINASLLGMITIGKLTLAAFSRADIPMDKRTDFYLYVDEFQNFTTPSISTILSEARKYRLCLTVAHQFIAQLGDEIREAVFGNVGSMVAFRVGPNDAEPLARQFEPVFSARELASIDNLNAHARLMVGGQVAPAFTLSVPLPERSDVSSADFIRDLSSLSYGRKREEAEQEIYERLRS